MRSKTFVSALALGAAAAIVFALGAGFGQPIGVGAGKPPPMREAGGPYRDVQWDDLVPTDWNPIKRFQRRNNANLDDGSFEAEKLQREMRSLWDNAPTVAALDGAPVKLAGYLVPLDEVDGALTEFLLVPYFGACIHTPPPPANQIVLVSARGARGFRTMETVSVSGRLSTIRKDTEMGRSGYRLAATVVEHYDPPGP